MHLNDRPASSTRGAAHNSLIRVVAEWVGLILTAFVIAQLITTFVVQLFIVPTGSMIPTITPGDRLIVAKYAYRFGDPKRGDVAVFKNWTAGQPDLVKRVIGIPGDTIAFQESGMLNGGPAGTFTVNGLRLDEPYLAESNRLTVPGRDGQGRPTRYPLRLGPGQYWLMGDNRNNSGDSRYNGPVARGMFIGKALFDLWPITDAKRL